MSAEVDQLKADLVAANAKVAEFRSTNIDLLKQLDALGPVVQKFSGLDADKVRADLAELETLRRQPAGASPERIAELEGKLAAAEAATATTTLRAAVSDAFTKAGGRAEALDFVLSKAQGLFTVADGQIVASVFSPDRPGERLTVHEFIAAQTKASPFVFHSSSGGGASGSTGFASGGGVREVVDPTPAQLGQLGAAIKAGTVRIKFTR